MNGNVGMYISAWAVEQVDQMNPIIQFREIRDFLPQCLSFWLY